MGHETCQVKYLMLRCYLLVNTKPLNYKPQLRDKTQYIYAKSKMYPRLAKYPSICADSGHLQPTNSLRARYPLDVDASSGV